MKDGYNASRSLVDVTQVLSFLAKARKDVLGEDVIEEAEELRERYRQRPPLFDLLQTNACPLSFVPEPVCR